MTAQTVEIEDDRARDALRLLHKRVKSYEEKRGTKPRWCLMGSDHPLVKAGVEAAWGVKFYVEDGVVMMGPSGPDIPVEGETFVLSVEHPMGDDQDEDFSCDECDQVGAHATDCSEF